MNLPDKIKNSNSDEYCMSEEAKAINQLIDYLKEKEELNSLKEDYSQSFNNFLGMNPEEELEKLTIRRTKE